MYVSRPPVVAAIPNFNMAESLDSLLPDVLGRGYDAVYVLDDASTDDSVDVARQHLGIKHVLMQPTNQGAGANRNQILDVITDPGALIHFIDADTLLDTSNSAEVIQDFADRPGTSFYGGLSKTPDGVQLAWNYGPRQSLKGDVGSGIQFAIDAIRVDHPKLAVNARKMFSHLLEAWPDQFSEPVARDVFWAVEQNLVVPAKIFSELGGFDPQLREHEIQDLAIRAAKRGLRGRFEPSLAVTHTAVEVREYDRTSAQARAELHIARKHGYLAWLLGRDSRTSQLQ